ncbi:MAG TPA: hypothetical protein VEH86_03895 [Candidatus Acidoferrum sp.]|nr:hypothetical protein [Candidatus Acidoferrum sp.]
MQEQKEAVEEQPKRASPIYEQILEVFYAPRKAFKEITKQPKYLGPILILILFVAANTAYGYVILSKSYLEQTLPKVDASANQFDAWTENASLWNSTPGVAITENFVDFINGSYYGNRSISFSTINSSQISMQIMNIGPANCTRPGGYENMSVRVKIVDPQTPPPSNASIYLFSGETSNYYYNLTDTFSSTTAGVWNNLTIPLDTAGWVNNNANADWGNITGLKLEFSWPQQNSNITMLVDGLFFRGLFQTPLDSAGASYLFSYSLSGILQFVIEWIFIGGIIFLAAKGLGSKMKWKAILIPVGFALIALVVQTIVNTIVISTLPSLYYPFEIFGGTAAEQTAAINALSNQVGLATAISGYIQLATLIWIIALCAIATRLTTEFSWVKSATISAAAVGATFLLGLLLGI